MMKEGVNLGLQKCFVLASHSPPGQRRWNGAGVALPEGSAAPGGARIASMLSYWPVPKHIHREILRIVQKNMYDHISTIFVTAHGSRHFQPNCRGPLQPRRSPASRALGRLVGVLSIIKQEAAVRRNMQERHVIQPRKAGARRCLAARLSTPLVVAGHTATRRICRKRR